MVSFVVALCAVPPANNGAGGSGRRGLPPYFDDGVPGRGLPFRSAGSYTTLADGGRVQSDGSLSGDVGLEGVPRSGEMCLAAAGGGIAGVVPRLEPGLDVCGRETVGRWYLPGAGLGALYEGTLSVFALRLKVTRAFSIGAGPVTTGASFSRVARASDNKEDNWVFLRRAILGGESCHFTR